jgi:hypothetical protein
VCAEGKALGIDNNPRRDIFRKGRVDVMTCVRRRNNPIEMSFMFRLARGVSLQDLE